MTKRMTLLIKAISLAAVVLIGVPAVMAQDAPAAAEDALPTDPADEIITHIEAMTKIVSDNMDAPDTVKTELTTYIKEHGEAMKNAGELFEKRMNGMSAEEAEAYNDSVQRRMEAPLEAFMTVMIQFSGLHPEAAKELDAILQEAK